MKKFNVGVKAVIRDDQGRVLLLKKNQENPFWEVPGGRIDGDESIEDALAREISEELPGAELKSVTKILCAHRLPKDIDKDLSLLLVYYLVDVLLPSKIELSTEHTDSIWVSSLNDVDLDGGTLKALTSVFS